LPIKILTEATKHLKEGETGYTIGVNIKDEIGELINSFNEMSLKLKEKDEKLLKSKEELEKEVEKRTKQLKDTLQELKITQRQIIHSEKLAAIGKLTSGIAHQINTPLTAIAGYSEALLRRIEEDKIDLNYMKEYLRIINEQAFQCKRTIEMLLSFSRPREIKFEWYDIEKILLESINLAKQEIEVKNAKIIYEGKIKEKIYVDGEQIKQVFLNIILNAIDAIKIGGEIKIELKENFEKIEISFTDNGEGIEEENLEKIFDPFWTTKKEKGTGLGLSISEEIIKGHSGEIKVKSKKGEGSTFTVVIPKIKKEGEK
jgi:two-component system NtrC family sensor kinase